LLAFGRPIDDVVREDTTMHNRLDDLMTKRRLSRRGFLGGTASALALPTLLATRRSAAAATNIDFVVWTYNLPTIQDNVAKFQERNSDVAVTVSDFPWNEFHQTSVQRFRSETATDVTYNGGDWLEEFARAGWVVPLQDYFPWALDYKEKTLGFAWQDMTYQDKVYGLPYYADTITFMYNEKILQDNGIAAPPQTWEEVTEQCLFLKGRGMEYPFINMMDALLPTITEVYASMVFGRGGELIDENKDPLFDKPESEAYKQFQWEVDARLTHKILTYEIHEVPVVQAMNTGKHVFTVEYNYNMASLNNAAQSPLAGQFKIALMPGATHECYGFAKFYNMTAMAVERGQEVIDACGKFIQYFAGETEGQYPVAKRWAVEDGLGFGQMPLFEDPDVQGAFGQFLNYDVWQQQLGLARARRQSEWYGIWSEFFRQEYAKAVAGETGVDEALGSSAERWNELKQQFQG
jgi:multiple sugar transport system substrate-binding protein